MAKFLRWYWDRWLSFFCPTPEQVADQFMRGIHQLVQETGGSIDDVVGCRIDYADLQRLFVAIGYRAQGREMPKGLLDSSIDIPRPVVPRFPMPSKN